MCNDSCHADIHYVMQISTMSCRYPLCHADIHYVMQISTMQVICTFRLQFPAYICSTVSAKTAHVYSVTSNELIIYLVLGSREYLTSCILHYTYLFVLYYLSYFFLYFLAYMFYVKASINKCYVCI